MALEKSRSGRPTNRPWASRSRGLMSFSYLASMFFRRCWCHCAAGESDDDDDDDGRVLELFVLME